jgi:hypothetical protein
MLRMVLRMRLRTSRCLGNRPFTIGFNGSLMI